MIRSRSDDTASAAAGGATRARWRAASRIWRLVISASGVAFLVILVLHVSPVIPALNGFLTDRWQEPAGDTLIVLAAEQIGDGTLGMVSYWRALYAVRAWRKHPFRRVVFSGAPQGAPGTPSAAASMAEFAIALGVPREIVVLEERSRSTRENALYTAELVRDWPGSKVLMTSDCHIRRARRSFEKAGLTVIAAPIPDIGKRWHSWPLRPECIWTVLTELAKNGYYTARGWI